MSIDSNPDKDSIFEQGSGFCGQLTQASESFLDAVNTTVPTPKISRSPRIELQLTVGLILASCIPVD